MKNRKTKFFIISGLSGSGKDSVVEGLKKEGLKFTRVITTTTRPKRKGEKQGKPYYFVSEKRFKKMIKNMEFLEWAKVYNHYYGNTKKEVEGAFKKKLLVILAVDCQGAKTIKEKIPEVKVIFLIVESLKNLEKRLIKRGQDSLKVIKKRIKTAKRELKTLERWNYVIINRENKLKNTIRKVKNIILKNL